MSPFPHIIALCGSKRAGKDAVAGYLAANHSYNVVKFATPLKKMILSLFEELTDEDLETDLKDVKHESLQVTPRSLMQWLGTEVFQNQIQDHIPHVGRRFWAEKLIKSLTLQQQKKEDDMQSEKLIKSLTLQQQKKEDDMQSAAQHAAPCSNVGRRYVISDLRFPHEVQALHDFMNKDDFVIIKVTREHPHTRHLTSHQQQPSEENDKNTTKEDMHCSEREFLDIIPDATIQNNSTLFDLHLEVEKVLDKLSGPNKTHI
jgi:dephospho-CoA kinase